MAGKQTQVDDLVAERVRWLSELQQQRSAANTALDQVEVRREDHSGRVLCFYTGLADPEHLLVYECDIDPLGLVIIIFCLTRHNDGTAFQVNIDIAWSLSAQRQALCGSAAAFLPVYSLMHV